MGVLGDPNSKKSRSFANDPTLRTHNVFSRDLRVLKICMREFQLVYPQYNNQTLCVHKTSSSFVQKNFQLGQLYQYGISIISTIQPICQKKKKSPLIGLLLHNVPTAESTKSPHNTSFIRNRRGKKLLADKLKVSRVEERRTHRVYDGKPS